MAVRLLKAQVHPGFSLDPSGAASLGLRIIGDTGVFGDNDIHLLMIPAVNASLSTDVGAVRFGATKPYNVPGGVLQFNGGTIATLPFQPGFSNPQFKSLMSFDLSGNPAAVTFSFDGLNNQVKASRACYAALAFSAYEAAARIILYTPETTILGPGTSTTFGTIAAFAQPNNLVTFQVQPTSSDEGNIEIELYRRVSFAVTTPDGEFEQPPGYPGTGSYPDRPLVIDVSTSLRTERVHEIGLMDAAGRGWVRNFFVPVKEPYIGDVPYSDTLLATLGCKISTLPPSQFSTELILKAKQFVNSKGYGC